MFLSPHGFKVESVWRLGLTTCKSLSLDDVLGETRGAKSVKMMGKD